MAVTTAATTTANVSEKIEPTANNNEDGALECDVETSFNSAVEEAVNTLLALTKQDNNNEEKALESCTTEAEKEAQEAERKAQEAERKAEEAERKVQNINRVRKGWSLDDCGAVSIGELYLMVNYHT